MRNLLVNGGTSYSRAAFAGRKSAQKGLRHAWADGLPAMKTWAACGCLTGSLWKPSESKWVEWNKPWRSYSPTGPQKHCLAGSFHPLIQKLRPPAGKYKSHHKSSSMSMLSWSPYKMYQHQPRPTILPNPSNARAWLAIVSQRTVGWDWVI